MFIVFLVFNLINIASCIAGVIISIIFGDTFGIVYYSIQLLYSVSFLVVIRKCYKMSLEHDDKLTYLYNRNRWVPYDVYSKKINELTKQLEYLQKFVTDNIPEEFDKISERENTETSDSISGATDEVTTIQYVKENAECPFCGTKVNEFMNECPFCGFDLKNGKVET